MKFSKIVAYHGKCEKHPKYRGIGKPRSLCEMCWRIYVRATGG